MAPIHVSAICSHMLRSSIACYFLATSLPSGSYLAQHGEDCRQPIQALEAEGEDAAARSATFHMGLLHA